MNIDDTNNNDNNNNNNVDNTTHIYVYIYIYIYTWPGSVRIPVVASMTPEVPVVYIVAILLFNQLIMLFYVYGASFFSFIAVFMFIVVIFRF